MLTSEDIFNTKERLFNRVNKIRKENPTYDVVTPCHAQTLLATKAGVISDTVHFLITAML